MKFLKNVSILSCTLLMWCTVAHAQLNTNPNKFLGNITTWGSVEAGDGVPSYWTLWNQITCENESKWSSVEGTRGSFNWNGANNAFNYAKQHNFTYKFHALVWGAQYPNWLSSLSAKERFAALTNWFDHAKAQYSTLPMIDVVNEAVGNHQAGNPMMKETLGGGGKTGYDWLIKAFEMAYERWPDAILIYNDFNSIRYDIDNYITLVQTLRDAGAPIDAYGNQAHELSGCSASELSSAMQKQQNALKMPMFITEYDIGDYEPETHGATQKSNFEAQIPVMWEAPYCAGITLWGYVYGKTWINLKEKDNPYQDARDEYGNLIGPGISGLYLDGEERPAMTWLREYMETDAAKNAVGPFPGTKKEASIYIRPASQKVANGDVLPIMVRARMATKTIEKVDLYVENKLIATMTEAPYYTEYEAQNTSGTSVFNTLKAVVTTTDGATYERYGRFQVLSGTVKREPYNETLPELPGIVKAEEFDKGLPGVSNSNVSTTVVKNRSKFSTTATNDGAWMEYTVDVKEDGLYTMEIEVASANADGRFHLAEYTFDNLKFLTEFTNVPNTGSATEFQTVRCPITEYLTAGRHVFTLLVEKGGFYIKNMKFNLLPTFNLPGIVEAEDMVNSEGVSIISTADGFALGNAGNGAWAEYLIKVNQTGKYAYEAKVSSEVSGSKFTMKLVDEKGNEISMPLVKVPNKGKDVYEVKTANIKSSIKEGTYTLRINVSGGVCNIDNINFVCTEPTGINEVENEVATDGRVYNLMGAPVDDSYRGIVIINGKKVVRK